MGGCGRTNFHPVPLWTTPSLMTSLGSITWTRSQEAPRVWYNSCRRYGSACLEDADSIEAIARLLEIGKDPDRGPYPRLRAISHGMKLLTRQTQRRDSTTPSVREQISQHSPSVSQSNVGPTPECVTPAYSVAYAAPVDQDDSGANSLDS